MKTFLTLLLVIIVLPLLSACATPSQIMADAEVRRLCEKDGGIKVYETVKLPAERFDEYGRISIAKKENMKSTDKFYFEFIANNLQKKYPKMWQFHYQIYRVSDEKLLGETILYSRVGGDMPGPWHSSSFQCPNKAGLYDLTKRIFIQE